MSDTFNYSLIQNEEGTYSIRSSVKSFNLDHVTDKDIVSFYRTFSQHASFDTGLLPLDGTGVLAIRNAGPHTQIVTQHKPGLYFVNWGSYEGDSSAKTYHLAQPYRIVIGDFENGQLLGARMFYSPYPITSPQNILYHVNLPNINCKGYRGNGVGWICLYHKDDWSSLPFNEKVVRFIERCSGIETYNDQNMSETDGPRFYSSHNKPAYLSDPNLWQIKSSEQGYEWTLDDQLWIPVLVTDMDNQGQHDPNGQPLTLAMAMLGNYQAYYTDKNIPKMYNKVSRSDLQLDNKDIASFIKSSFAAAPVNYLHTSKDDPYSFTVAYREKNGSEQYIQPAFNFNQDDDDEDFWVCYSCEDSFSTSDADPITDYYGNNICSSCTEDYAYIESIDAYFQRDDDCIIWSQYKESYFHTQYDTVQECNTCMEWYAEKGTSAQAVKNLYSVLHPYYSTQDHDECVFLCDECYKEAKQEDDLETVPCYTCHSEIVLSGGPEDVKWHEFYPTSKGMVPKFKEDLQTENVIAHFCFRCSSDLFICPCGFVKHKNDIEVSFGNCTPTPIQLNNETTLTVDKCCYTCLGPVVVPDDPLQEASASFQPVDLTNIHKSFEQKIYDVNLISIKGISINNNLNSADITVGEF